MPKLVLLDNSLSAEGGHHSEFAEYLCEAAEQDGYTPIIGAHLKLPESVGLQQRWRVERVFADTIYHHYNLLYRSRWEAREAVRAGLSLPGRLQLVAKSLHDMHRRWREHWWKVKRFRKVRSFVRGCRDFFSHTPLERGDIIILPTVSDVELEALGRVFRDCPGARAADWHVYFHNNFLEGRPAEYENQKARLALMRKSLQACLKHSNGARVAFHATTEQLCQQYRGLNSDLHIDCLTFPVRQTLRQSISPRASEPKRVVCAGGFREERGQSALPEIVSTLWNDLLAPGKVQLVVQRPDPQWEVPLPKRAAVSPIEYQPHPLSTEGYNELIQQADIGLLLHDSRSYYSRLSAVLQEYFCAGIPVLAPAGCWLGDQLGEENVRYLEEVLRERQHQVVGRPALQWPNQAWMACLAELELPASATELVVQAQWIVPPGQYVRARIESLGPDSHWHPVAQTVLSQRGSGFAAMFHLPSRASSARLIFENAFADEDLLLGEPDVTLLSAPDAGQAGLPTGSSGLAFAERSEIPRLLREMIAHYSHYRERAYRKSHDFCRTLTPEKTWAEIRASHRQQHARPALSRAA